MVSCVSAVLDTLSGTMAGIDDAMHANISFAVPAAKKSAVKIGGMGCPAATWWPRGAANEHAVRLLVVFDCASCARRVIPQGEFMEQAEKARERAQHSGGVFQKKFQEFKQK